MRHYWILLLFFTITYAHAQYELFNPFLNDHPLELEVVILSYNNAKFCRANLDSVIFQQVDVPFHITYVNDCSIDQTGILVEEYKNEYHLDKVITIIHNQERLGMLENMYRVIHSLSDHKIIINLDGDDFLAHDLVLARVLQEFQDKNTWFCYSKCRYQSSENTLGEVLPDHIIHANDFRQYTWVTSHLKTFYAGLYKHIKREDLLYEGKFFEMAGDFAFTYPMLELSSEGHIRFIDEILYIYNDCNPISDHNKNWHYQTHLGQYIRALPMYEPLQKEKADLVIFSFDRPLQLYALLESIDKYITGLNEIHVIYRTSNHEYQVAYELVNNHFSKVHFHQQGHNYLEDFGPLTLHAAFDSPSKYILFAVDDIIVKDFIDISYDISLLKRTKAYGFYYRLAPHLYHCHPVNCQQKVPPLTIITDHIFTWSFCDGEYDWAYPNNVDMTLYCKADIKDDLYAISLTTPSCEAFWHHLSGKQMHKYGLCYELSKIVNIPLNRVQDICKNPHMGISKEYLLEQFMAGFKIDIDPFYRINNKGAHTDYEIEFIPR